MKEKKETIKKENMKGYRFLRGVLKPVFKFYYHPTIVGAKNIPAEGPILICINHIHVMDQCMALVATKRDVNYMAKKEYFDGKTKWFFKMAGCIPVNRQIKDNEATERALNILNYGGAVGLFPEGTRNKTDEIIQPFKFGAVSMAQKTGAKIVPCGIYGHYKFRSKDLTIVIGEPFAIEKDEDLAEVNEKFRNKVLSLIYEAKKLSEERNK